jgi:hypothetical protein
VGDVSVGLFRDRGRAIIRFARAHDAGDGETQREVVDHFESHVGRRAGTNQTAQHTWDNTAKLMVAATCKIPAIKTNDQRINRTEVPPRYHRRDASCGESEGLLKTL